MRLADKIAKSADFCDQFYTSIVKQVKKHVYQQSRSLRSSSSFSLLSTTNVKLAVTTVIIIIIAFSIYSGSSAFLLSSSSSYRSSAMIKPAYAQAIYGLKTIKTRDLVIDLGNGVKTKAQLTLPMLGNGPFPGVLLIHGSGVADKDYFVTNNIAPFLQMSQYLSERGFAVLRYDKRGVGSNFTVADANVWGNVTFNDLKNDAEKALDVLIKQPEVDPSRITLIGHSEGTTIVPRVAIDNPTKVKNIVLMGAAANNTRDLVNFREVTVPLLYAQRVLDHNHDGLISVREAIKDPVFNFLTRDFTLLLNTSTTTNDTKQQQPQSNTLQQQPQYNTTRNSKDGYMSINDELKPRLIAQAKALSTIIPGQKCTSTAGCPIWLNSQYALQPNVDIIGNVPHSISILIQQGDNDIATPLQQAFLLHQALIDKKHPDHTLITYPGLGHGFNRQSEWYPVLEGVQPYVLADLYSWLAAHSGFTTTSTFSATAISNDTSNTITPSFPSSSTNSATNK